MSTFVSHACDDTSNQRQMIIYSPIGTQILDAPVTKEAIVKYALMSDYYIELPFNQHQYLQIPQGSYILYKGRKFEIMAPVYPEFDNSTGGYKYSLLFQAQQNHMKRFVCFWLGGPNPEAVFHNTTDLASFGALIVANMNKALGTDNWRLGTISVENSDAAKLVSFNGDKCWDAVNTIAETFEVEWWTDESGGIITLNFGKLIIGTAEDFKRGNVVKTIPAKKGDDSSYGTRFYVFGSTRNLTSQYGQAEQGGETNHVSEIRLRLPDGQRYIDAISDLDKSAIVEQVVFFDDIYPKNTETVLSVETIDRVLIEGRTDKAYVMVCPDTPFVPSDVIAGETLGAHFTSGDLMGWDFELALIDNNGNKIDPATWKPEDGFNKKFEIIAQVETLGGSDHIIPNENLRPRGEDDERGPDTFVLTGVKLPKQRIDEAEQELLTVGTSYAAKHSSDTDVYDCDTNPVYCQNNDKNYEAGQAVRLVDPRFGNSGRLSRIQGYEKKLYNEYIATYTIGDNTPYSRMGSIESDVKATLYSQRIGVTESGASIYLITRYDGTFPTDANAYSARRAMWEFANKQAADTFKGRMTFNAGAQFGNFAGGVNGIGGFIDNNGNSELDSLKLRRFLEVPEFRYNRVDVTMGDTWFAPCAGIIESVDAEAKTITLKLEEGEIGSPRVGDICMGIFHSSDFSNNATEDYDDSKGNRRFAGFATCYFRITETLDATSYKTFKYELRPLSAAYPKQYHPASSMTFVGYGSFSNVDRRTSRYETRTYQRYLQGVSDWEFTTENIAAQFGDLSNLSVFGLAMSGYSAYLDNIYMQGMLRSLDGTFIIDTKTRSLLMASGETGIGLAFNPAQGLKIGTVYDPATGRFQKEYDIQQIAQDTADAKYAAVTAQTAVNGLKNFTDIAFADGVIDRAEAAAIEKYANSVTETSKAADASYSTIYNNVMLGGSAKTNLQAAKSAFDTTVADLLASISIAASDGKASEAEREDVNAKYAIFNTAYATFTMRIEEAQKYIQTAINATAQDAHQLSSVLLDYINLLNESVIPDLQHQIDRQIISYNGADVPTLSNYPASEWTTAEERNRHINDYYDRKITADGTIAYERYKFVLENNVYQWVRIADSGAAEAQAKAMEALGVADSKNKVYFGDATPSVPYSINDLWFKSSGNIYISNADKKKDALGSISDWQLANDAQIRLRQMSSDNVISQEEKASLRNTLLQREKEMVAYKADASKYGVTISALNTAYLNLVNFLTGTIAVNNDTDTEITSDQRISYNTYFASYDTEVSRFTNLVADKRSTDYTDKQVDSLQKKIDAAQKAAEEANSKLTQWGSDHVISPPEKTGLKLQQSDIQAEYTQIVTEGSQYQLSTTAYVTAYRAAVTALTKYTASTPELIPVEEDYANIARYYTARGVLLGMIAEAAKRIMDDTASAVSDIDYLKQLFPVSLEVDGVVIARVLAVKNDAGTAVTSFFNGSAVYKDSEHGICMIATGMNGLSNWETAKTRIYADGAIITDKLIATNANISGNITASSGNIGGFKINDPTSDFYNPSLNFTTSSPIAHGNYSIELGGWGMAVSRGRAGSNFDDRIVIAPASAYKGFPPTEAENNVSMGIQAYSSVLYKSNIALMLNAGTALSSVEIIPGDHALYISKGDICGFRLRTQTMTSGKNAVDMDSIIFSEATAATGVTLPASPQAGQIYFIRKVNSGNVSVWVGNQSTQNIRKNYNTSAKYVTIEYGHLGIFMWNEKGNYWTANYCPNM